MEQNLFFIALNGMGIKSCTPLTLFFNFVANFLHYNFLLGWGKDFFFSNLIYCRIEKYIKPPIKIFLSL